MKGMILAMGLMIATCPMIGIGEEVSMDDRLKQAEKLFHEGRFVQARVQYFTLLEDHPTDKLILSKLANIAMLDNKPDLALQYWKRVYEQSSWLGRRWPMLAQLSYDMGSAYHRKGDFQNAAKWYRRSAGPIALGPLKTVKAMQRQLEAFGDSEPYRIDGDDEAVLPFVTLDPLPVVEIMVNGQGPFNFFIDTGGADLILLPELADKLNIVEVSEMDGSFASRKKAGVGLGKIDSVTLSSLTVHNLPVHIIALEGIEEGFQRPIHGAIGTTLLRQFYSILDYAGRRLVLRRIDAKSSAELATLAATDVTIPFWLAQQHMMMARGHVNNLPDTLFFVDTGLANHGFLISSATQKAAGVEVDWSQADEGIGGGGVIKSVQFTLDKITLGEGDTVITKENVSSVMHEQDISVFTGNLGFDVGGLISHGFFKGTSLTMDFEKMRLIVQTQGKE